MRPTEEMIDAPRFLIQLRTETGLTYEKLRDHMRVLGRPLGLLPDWAQKELGFITASGWAMLIYHIMQNADNSADRNTEKKLQFILDKDAILTGYVIRKKDQVAILEQGSVVWMDKKDFHKLMHPHQGGGNGCEIQDSI